MPLIGQLALALALLVAVYSITANLLGIRCNSTELLLSARHALWAMCAMVTVAVAALWTGLLTSDFSLEYVASYLSVTLPLPYKFAALWGGQQGSLLFWTWLLSIFTSIAIWQNRRRNPEITPWALIVLAAIAVFFLGMLNFVTRPFDLLATVPLDGSDLNPLLQNYWMAIHPPSLYTGYVSASVPFAFACGALITRRLDDAWIRTTRRWAIFSWFFLTLGNLLAHAGRTRSWDGVATGPGIWSKRRLHAMAGYDCLPALGDDAGAQGHAEGLEPRAGRDGLHADVVRHVPDSQRRDFLGPFLHAVGTGAILPDFSDCRGCRLHGAPAEPVEDLSRVRPSSSRISRARQRFLFNNLMLVGIAFAVFWGTVFPVLSEAVRGVRSPSDPHSSIPLTDRSRSA